MESGQTAYKITKEEHHFTSEEKLKHCGYGEWVEEPDTVHLQYEGYEAIINRIFRREPYARPEAYFGGHLGGYVKIPEHHRYFRRKNIIIACHGGVTMNECHEEHWIGFDCGHFGDMVPTIQRMGIKCPSTELNKGECDFPELLQPFLLGPFYRNIAYCIQECIDIITQLIGADNMAKPVKKIVEDHTKA